MTKTEGKFKKKVRHYLLDFRDEEEQLEQAKKKRTQALARLRSQAKARG